MRRVWREVYRSSLKFLFPLTTRRTYKMIVDEAVRLTGAKYASLFLEEEETGRLKRMATNLKDLYSIGLKRKGMTQRAYRQGKILKRKRKELVKAHPEFKKLDVGENMSVPLTFNGIDLGVLGVLSTKNKKFSEQDEQILDLFAPLAMMAIRKARLLEMVTEALKTRDLFISMAAHELKSPLVAIWARTELLTRKVRAGKRIVENDLSRLSSEQLRLSRMIDNFLTVDRIRRGKLSYKMEECDLLKVMDKALENFKYMYENRQMEYTNKIKGQAKIRADKDKLVEVIINLLANAAKYSKEDQVIEIGVWKRNGLFGLRIKDRGIGIPRKDLPSLTRQFYRASNARGSGMGLGMYLVAQIVKAHKGKLEIKSVVNKGTEVKIRLPQLKRWQRQNG